MRPYIIFILACLVVTGCAKKSRSADESREVNLGTETTVATVPEFVLQVDFSSANSATQDFWFEWREDGKQVRSKRTLAPVFDQNPIDIKVAGCLEFDWLTDSSKKDDCLHRDQGIQFTSRGLVSETNIDDVLEDGILASTHISLSASPLPRGLYQAEFLFHDAARNNIDGVFEFFVDGPDGRSSLGFFTPSAGSNPDEVQRITFEFQLTNPSPLQIYVRCINTEFVLNGFSITKFFGEPEEESPSLAKQCKDDAAPVYEFLQPTLWTERFSSNSGSSSFPGESFRQSPRLVGDFNNDGLDDLLFINSKGAYLAETELNRITEPKLWLPAGDRFAGNELDQEKYPFVLGDINGDGRSDLVYFGENETAVALNLAKESPKWQSITSEFTLSGGWDRTDTRLSADLDGDGRDEIVGIQSDRIITARLNEEGTGLDRLSTSAYDMGSGSPRFLKDIDQDGKAELIVIAEDGLYLADESTSEDDLFGPLLRKTTEFSPAAGWLDQEKTPRFVGAFRTGSRAAAQFIGLRDGKFVAISNLSGSPKLIDLKELDSFASSKDELQNYRFDRDPFAIGDLNGDGVDDLVYFGYQGTFVSLAVRRCSL